jgi:hypothetical protein
MRKKLKIPYTKERVVLSDILPYEAPLIFSNRYFYKLLNKLNKAKQNEEYKKKNFKAFKEINYLLFNSAKATQPFRFSIKHKESDFRQLNIIHPNNQKSVSEFYEKYKNLILYYSSISQYSIRKPKEVASFTFHNDILHGKTKTQIENSLIEENESEYENLKSYFSYQKYSNIHKFYESYQFHRSEKKFNKLLKIDISKCFDSIYTHTISWALFNKSIIKDNIDDSRKTFAGEFDELMQKLNANETNGIIIGPEFSRIFAELILQQIDNDILNKLLGSNYESQRLINKKDYQIFRYIDDYFIFYNKEEDIERILKEFKLSLKEYKLSLNEKKSICYSKPIISAISQAKIKISDLFNSDLKFTDEKHKDEKQNSTDIHYFSSGNTITRFKSIIKENNIEYSEIMNYSLSVLDNKTLKITNKWYTLNEEQRNNEKCQKQFEKALLDILDISFFLYSVEPRVNSTIKICLIIDKIISFLKKNKTNNFKEPLQSSYKHNVYKKLFDEIFQVLHKNKSDKTNQIECLYLLIALNQLGREYRLNPKTLCSYFNIESKNGKIIIKNELNYFCIMVLLFYIKDIKVYTPIKEELKKYIYRKFENKKVFEWRNDAELVMTLLDILSCPYLNDNNRTDRYIYKKSILNLLNIGNHKNLIEAEKFWFIKWINFDFSKELQAKRSQEVY